MKVRPLDRVFCTSCGRGLFERLTIVLIWELFLSFLCSLFLFLYLLLFALRGVFKYFRMLCLL